MRRAIFPFRLLFYCALLLPFIIGTGTGTAANYLVSERAYRALAKAEEQMQAQAHADAVETIDNALKRRGLSEYERALLQRLAGAALLDAGEHAAAATRLQAALDGETLPEAMLEKLRYQLAQLYLHESRYEDALAVSKPWREAGAQPSAAVCFVIASANAALERLPEALRWGETRFEAERERETRALRRLKPTTAFVAGLNLALERYPRAAELLEQLISHYPQTAQHWRQLTAVYHHLDLAERALAVAELGHLRGALTTARDLDRLARLYLRHDLPHKAALLLDDALQNAAAGSASAFDAPRYRLLANAWVAAREYARALAPLEQAAALLRAADDPGREAEVRLLKGIAHAHLEQPGKAARELAHCLDHPGTRKAAGQWLSYVEARKKPPGGAGL